MLLRTYEKIIDEFYANNGYMNFEQLKERGVTAPQIQELLKKGVLEKFARGWYWCGVCGRTRPAYHKYVEIGMANPNAVICMDSACFLHGLLSGEPEVISAATERTDRKRMEFGFPVNRYYLQNTGKPGEIEEVHTEFGSYKVYSADRAVCDCIRMRRKLSPDMLVEIEKNYRKRENTMERLEEYAKGLRALRCIKEMEWSEGE